MAAAFDFADPNALAQLIELTIGYGVGGAASRLIDPIVQGGANAAWTEAPNMPTDVVTLARLKLLGRISEQDSFDEAANSGFNPTRFRRYIDALKVPPSTEQLLELARRGVIDGAALETALREAGLDERYLNEYLNLRRAHLSPADAAMARQQEFIDDAELERLAAIGGLTADDGQLLYKMAGLPPGIETGLEMLRRGIIDEQTFDRIVAEGHTKTKYTPYIRQLLYRPLSAAVAAEALIRERISEADAVKIAEQNGISRQDFLTWSNMLGRPPGIMEALSLVNRRLLGDPNGAEAKAFFRQVVARSDVRTEYADQLYALRTHYPPLFQVSRAIQNGVIDDQLARTTLEHEGYPEPWIDALIKAGKAPRTAKHKDLAASIVEALYLAGLETHDAALLALEHLGYDEKEAADYLGLWLARRIVAELVRGIGIIRSRYTGWKIDRTAASADLDQLTGDPSVRERLLPLWDTEREANAPVLTTAQVGQALHYGRFSVDQAIERWQQMGFTQEDAITHAWIVLKGDPFKTTTPVEPPSLPAP